MRLGAESMHRKWYRVNGIEGGREEGASPLGPLPGGREGFTAASRVATGADVAFFTPGAE